LETIDPDPLPDLLSVFINTFYKGFSVESGISILALLVLIIGSALVSGSETAFFSMSPADLDRIRNRNDKTGNLILKLLDIPKKLLATILISNNFINVAIVILSTYITSQLFDLEQNPVATFVIQVIVVTSLILIFCEIAPKILANKHPVKVATMMAPTMKFLVGFFSPLSSILVNSTNIIDKRLEKKGHTISMSDLSEAIDIAVADESDDEEKSILKGIATFGQKEASEIMRSRVNVTAIDIELTFDDVVKVILESGFSRIPVYKENFDHVQGLLYIKDLLPHLNKKTPVKWQKLIRPAFFVPENKKINDLLQEFREKKIHLAIVVDEYGGTSGIITLEDIIEEIVGEIYDEYDKEDAPFHFEKLSDNVYLFDAKTPLNDLCKMLDIDNETFDEVKGESDSLGGLILEIEGKIPIKGSKISFDRFSFEVVDADERKLNKIKVTIEEEK
jgi:gliding motility-associated protein GldE